MKSQEDSIVIVDYGMGNLASIQNMLKYLGIDSTSTSDKNVIEKAEKIILPGVGAFDNAIQNIHKLGLLEILNHQALDKKVPCLGICLGMQLITNGSEEGRECGFGWIDAETIKFRCADKGLKIPHIGWNHISIMDKTNPLFYESCEDSRYYFVHSYHVRCKDKKNVVCQTEYGDVFDSVISNENIYGCQFHPEKSHKFGLRFLTNFAGL